MRRTASSTASLQHRDITVAVLSSARLNEEAPHDSRAASPIRLNRLRAAAGEVSSRRSYRTRISVVSNPVGAAWPSVDAMPANRNDNTIQDGRRSRRLGFPAPMTDLSCPRVLFISTPSVVNEESFLLTGLRSSRYSTVQFVRTVLVLLRIQSCLELPVKQPASSKSWRWSESA